MHAACSSRRHRLKFPSPPHLHASRPLIRRTDGGSDNVGWVAHAFHFALVYFGVANKITWMRLPPGHSHNGGDRKFSLIKVSVESQTGAFSLWDLEKAIIEGCKRNPLAAGKLRFRELAVGAR
jgi:hypothetical protein